MKLYERCLIPCANYSEFWIRYVEFVDAKGGREIAKYALDRALTVFLKVRVSMTLVTNIDHYHFFLKRGTLYRSLASLLIGIHK